MRHFATLALAALLLAPAAFAQSVTAAGQLVPAPLDASLAIGDTTVIANRTDADALTTFSDGNGNYLFGTGSFGTEIFGSGYTLPEDGTFNVIGAILFVTVPPDAGETFDILVYEGTLDSGPVGDPVYMETFDTDIIPPLDGTTVTATQVFFDQQAEVNTPAFFIVYDVNAVTGDFGAGATGLQDDPAPETIVFRGGAFVRVDAAFTSGGNPLQVYLFGDAIVEEVEDREAPVLTLGDARGRGVGAEVSVEGTVTRSQGAFTYLEDETGAIAIRQTGGDFAAAVESGDIAPGTTIMLTGTLSEFNGLLQINNADLTDYTITGTADVPDPQIVTLAELAADGEDYESELVRIDGVTIDPDSDGDGTPEDTFMAGTNYGVTDASDGSNAVSLRVPSANDTEVDGIAIPTDVVSVVGIASQFDPAGAAGYQILAIQSSDIGGSVAIGEDPEGRLALAAAQPNPSAQTAAMTVSLAAPGRATLAIYDVLGREVARVVDRDLAAGDFVVRVDVSVLPAGTYLARLTANGGTAVRPFTVAR